MGDDVARDDRWREAGLVPLSLDAPAYRLLSGAPLATVWVAGYHPTRWNVDDLDERYSLDHTTMPAPDPDDTAGAIRRGDVVIWIGPAKEGRKITNLVWPPSLVVAVRGVGDGMVKITSIRDNDLAAYTFTEAADLTVDWDTHVDGERAPQSVPSSLLDLWELDLWCPECGHLGQPIRWGMTGAPRTRDMDGKLLPWPEGLTHDIGCMPPEPPTLYWCERCDNTWGTDRWIPEA